MLLFWLLFCPICGTVFDSSFMMADDKCPVLNCRGFLTENDVRILDVIQKLNHKGFDVIEAICSSPLADIPRRIFIEFRDDFGNHFSPLPAGFELFGSNPEKHPKQTKIVLAITWPETMSRFDYVSAQNRALADLADWVLRIW
jgi:hypothetical protein